MHQAQATFVVGVAHYRTVGLSLWHLYVRSGYKEDVMAIADQFKALIRSHAEGDDACFYAIADAGRRSNRSRRHSKFALELREIVDQVKARSKVAPARARVNQT